MRKQSKLMRYKKKKVPSTLMRDAIERAYIAQDGVTLLVRVFAE